MDNSKIELEDTEDYSPYCKLCSACGESGCCSPMMCSFEEGCEYKNGYLKELKEEYIFVREFYEKIYPTLPEVVQKDITDLYMSIEL